MKLHFVFFAIFFFSGTFTNEVLWAHDQNGTQKKSQNTIKLLRTKVTELEGVIEKLNSKITDNSSVLTDPEYKKSWIEYKKSMMARNSNMYTWQGNATETIHYFTLSIVVVALVVAIGQIIFGMVFHVKKQATYGKKDQDQSTQQLETLELSAARIRITTTVSGIILFLITFAFFYIYVHEVYTAKLPV